MWLLQSPHIYHIATWTLWDQKAGGIWGGRIPLFFCFRVFGLKEDPGLLACHGLQILDPYPKQSKQQEEQYPFAPSLGALGHYSRVQGAIPRPKNMYPP